MGVFLSQGTLGIPVYMKDGPSTKNKFPVLQLVELVLQLSTSSL